MGRHKKYGVSRRSVSFVLNVLSRAFCMFMRPIVRDTFLFCTTDSYHWHGTVSVTNNVAEYCGLLQGLQQAAAMQLSELTIQGDSELVLKQIQGVYKVRNAGLKLLHGKCLELLSQIPRKTFEHIPRKLNSRADSLANLAMDSERSNSSATCTPTTASSRDEVQLHATILTDSGSSNT